MSIVKINPYMIEPLEIENYVITANANVIFNSLTGRVEMSAYTKEFQFQGSVSGYTSGGFALPNTVYNIIDKFPFAANGNASDVGDLSVARRQAVGQSSIEHGYTSGGDIGPGAPNVRNIIDKFPFATNANASDVGDLTQSRTGSAGQSSAVSGYTSGGYAFPAPSPPTFSNTIDKFPFASNANASDVGDLSQARVNQPAGQSSSDSGYTSGGSIPPAVNTIDKFPFATDANATDVGDLTQVRYGLAGQSSTSSGYSSGGAPDVNTIDKFPFASNANATDVGDLTQVRYFVVGQSSTTSGYSSGGVAPSSVNTIDKFPFASNANATDVGNLTVARYSVAGQQI